MKKVYIVAGILFMGVVAGIWAWKSMSSKSQPELAIPQAATSDRVEDTIVASPSAVTANTEESKSMKPKQYASPPEMSINPAKPYTATLTTDKGAMVVRLNAKDAPITVNNFVFLAREGFYGNTIFHRIIKGFMIQGGDPLGTGTGGPGYRFADEPITRDYTRGTIAMANSGPNTNGSQFFIMHENYALPKNYVIFGAIDPTDTASLVTLDAIAASPATDNGMGETSKPVTPTVLQSITVKEE